MFTTTSASSTAAISATLSGTAGMVASRHPHVPAEPRTASAIRSSSVATQTKSTNADLDARLYTYSIMGCPHNKTSGFPGKRTDAQRAGMTAMISDAAHSFHPRCRLIRIFVYQPLPEGEP